MSCVCVCVCLSTRASYEVVPKSAFTTIFLAVYLHTYVCLFLSFPSLSLLCYSFVLVGKVLLQSCMCEGLCWLVDHVVKDFQSIRLFFI